MYEATHYEISPQGSRNLWGTLGNYQVNTVCTVRPKIVDQVNLIPARDNATELVDCLRNRLKIFFANLWHHTISGRYALS
jgi:hypothetical protein